VSLVDASNPAVFLLASALGMKGTELPTEFTAENLAEMEFVRSAAAVRLGLVGTATRAAEVTPTVPKIYMMSESADYVDLTGRAVRADEINLVGRGLSMRVPHQTYASTVAVATATAALIPGTIVAKVIRLDAENPGRIRIGHPSGVVTATVAIDWHDGRPALRKAPVERTARRIMDGIVYVPIRRLLSGS
jgi:hypothetical protein